MTAQHLNLVLVLNPWLDNPISVSQVKERVGDDARIYPMTDFGVEQSRLRRDAIPWTRWTKAIDAMLLAAEQDAEREPERDRCYTISGRAPLPLFAYVGMRLSKWAPQMKVINRSERGWDEVQIARGEATEEPFFLESKHSRGLAEEGKVAVFISTEHEMDIGAVSAYMKKTKEPLVAAVELRTEGRRWLTAENAAAAAAEIDAELQGLRKHYPRHTGLVLFIAGPAHLAVMVGRSINFRIHHSADFPNYAGPDYVRAVEYPPEELPPRLLVLSADPAARRTEEGKEVRLRSIQDGYEIRSIRDVFRSLAGRTLDPLFETSVTAEHLMSAMRRHDPHILHVSAHGSKDGDIGLVDPGNLLAVAPMEAFKRAILATGTSLRLVILSACYSAVLARQLAQHVDYVIGVDIPILTPTAIGFAKGFYAALGDGCNLAEALEQGRSEAALKGLKGAEKIEGFPREGFDPSTWTPYPKRELLS